MADTLHRVMEVKEEFVSHIHASSPTTATSNSNNLTLEMNNDTAKVKIIDHPSPDTSTPREKSQPNFHSRQLISDPYSNHTLLQDVNSMEIDQNLKKEDYQMEITSQPKENNAQYCEKRNSASSIEIRQLERIPTVVLPKMDGVEHVGDERVSFNVRSSQESALGKSSELNESFGASSPLKKKNRAPLINKSSLPQLTMEEKTKLDELTSRMEICLVLAAAKHQYVYRGTPRHSYDAFHLAAELGDAAITGSLHDEEYQDIPEEQLGWFFLLHPHPSYPPSIGSQPHQASNQQNQIKFVPLSDSTTATSTAATPPISQSLPSTPTPQAAGGVTAPQSANTPSSQPSSTTAMKSHSANSRRKLKYPANQKNLLLIRNDDLEAFMHVRYAQDTSTPITPSSLPPTSSTTAPPAAALAATHISRRRPPRFPALQGTLTVQLVYRPMPLPMAIWIPPPLAPDFALHQDEPLPTAGAPNLSSSSSTENITTFHISSATSDDLNQQIQTPSSSDKPFHGRPTDASSHPVPPTPTLSQSTTDQSSKPLLESTPYPALSFAKVLDSSELNSELQSTVPSILESSNLSVTNASQVIPLNLRDINSDIGSSTSIPDKQINTLPTVDSSLNSSMDVDLRKSIDEMAAESIGHFGVNYESDDEAATDSKAKKHFTRQIFEYDKIHKPEILYNIPSTSYQFKLNPPMSSIRKKKLTKDGEKLSTKPIRTVCHIDRDVLGIDKDECLIVFRNNLVEGVIVFIPLENLPLEFANVARRVATEMIEYKKYSRLIRFTSEIETHYINSKAPASHRLSNNFGEWEDIYTEEALYPEQMSLIELQKVLTDRGANSSGSVVELRHRLRGILGLEPDPLDELQLELTDDEDDDDPEYRDQSSDDQAQDGNSAARRPRKKRRRINPKKRKTPTTRAQPKTARGDKTYHHDSDDEATLATNDHNHNLNTNSNENIINGLESENVVHRFTIENKMLHVDERKPHHDGGDDDYDNQDQSPPKLRRKVTRFILPSDLSLMDEDEDATTSSVISMADQPNGKNLNEKHSASGSVIVRFNDGHNDEEDESPAPKRLKLAESASSIRFHHTMDEIIKKEQFQESGEISPLPATPPIENPYSASSLNSSTEPLGMQLDPSNSLPSCRKDDIQSTQSSPTESKPKNDLITSQSTNLKLH